MNFDIFSSLFSNLWSIFLVIIFFGGSIFIHELGHFLAAKKRGLKVERFSIGFGPKIFGWRKGETEYRISLFPLGGYVALPELSDMSAIEGKSKLDLKSAKEISYTDKMIVLVMGAVFNLIFAFILAFIIWIVGQPSSKEQLTNTVGYVAKTIQVNVDNEIPGPAYEAGIHPGDKILAVDGIKMEGFNDIQQYLVTGTGRTAEGLPQTIFTIERNGKVEDVTVYPKLIELNGVSKERMRFTGISPEQSLVIDEVLKDSPANLAGLQKKDVLISANGTRLYSLKMLSDIIEESPNHEILLTVNRGNDLIETHLKGQAVPYTKPMGLLTGLTTDNQVRSVKFLPIYSKEQKDNFTDPKTPSHLIVFENLAADSHRFFEPGNILFSVDDKPIHSLQDFLNFANTSWSKEKVEFIEKKASIPDNMLRHELLSKNLTFALLPPLTQFLVGIQLNPAPLIIHVNPVKQFINTINMTFRTLGSLFHRGSDLSVSNLMGPPGIIRVLHSFSVSDLRLLIWFVILLNINLAILNLLPIPVLDGGHIMFATIAKLRGKPLPAKVIGAIQGTFMLLLLGFMLYVSFFDVRRWQGDRELSEKLEREQELYIPRKFIGKE